MDGSEEESEEVAKGVLLLAKRDEAAEKGELPRVVAAERLFQALPDDIQARSGKHLTMAERQERMASLKKRSKEEGRESISVFRITKLTEKVFNKYADMSSRQAKERCEIAASEIGRVVQTAGLPVEYVGVLIWPKAWENGPNNHYVVVVEDIVIDATAHQFPKLGATITPFSTWLADLQTAFPSHWLGKYRRGSWTECRDFAGTASMDNYYWDADGTPLGDYDPEVVRKSQQRATQYENLNRAARAKK